QLSHLIMEGEQDTTRFTELFGTAPVWLLQFTGMAMDARLLKFRLPDLTKTLKWGSAGYEDARRWPLLPLGVMTAGNPIPDSSERLLWITLFCMRPEGDSIRDLEEYLSRDFEEYLSPEERSYRKKDSILDAMFFALELDGSQKKNGLAMRSGACASSLSGS